MLCHLSFNEQPKNKREETCTDQSAFLLSLLVTDFSQNLVNKTMIRVFYAFYKSKFMNISDLSLFHQAIEAFQTNQAVCPLCHAKYACAEFASYSRHLITYEKEAVVCHDITIPRVICASCGHTHAILPDVLIPYGSYSLRFILIVLRRYFLKSTPIVELCEAFHISVSTLYAWIQLFHSQKKLWLGFLKDNELSSSDFIRALFSGYFSPESFFRTFQFSFLQSSFTTHYDSSQSNQIFILSPPHDSEMVNRCQFVQHGTWTIFFIRRALKCQKSMHHPSISPISGSL